MIRTMIGEDIDDYFAAFVTHAAASIFDAFVPGSLGAARRRYYEQFFEVVAPPGEFLADALESGDLLLRRGEAGLGHAALIVAPELWQNEQLSAEGLRPESKRPGLFAHVVEYSAGPNASATNLARLIAETNGLVPHGQLILRRRGVARAGRPGGEDVRSAAWAEKDTPEPVNPPLTPNPSPPAGLVLVPHWHMPRTCKKDKDGGTAYHNTDGKWTPMSPSTMNPGFLTADDKIVRHAALSEGLNKLLLTTPKYAAMLSPRSKSTGAPHAEDKIRVALVDLTIDKTDKYSYDRCQPGFAGWGEALPIRGGSIVKLAVLYAAHQLRADLQQFGVTGRTVAGLRKEADRVWSKLTCKPDLDWLFEFSHDGSPQTVPGVRLSPRLHQHLEEMISSAFSDVIESRTSELILRLGFEYIASVLWQSGLRHPTRRGLWIRNTFPGASFTAKTNPACHAGRNPVVWTKTPFKDETINGLTALSLATFFTLLGQKRLVSEFDSDWMKERLATGCRYFYIPGGIHAASGSLTRVKGAESRHDAALLSSAHARYVLVVLTKDPDWKARADFFVDVNAMVKGVNP